MPEMQDPGNYNTYFQYRTTYGVIYIYTPVNIDNPTIIAHFDDGGIVWLNGTVVGSYATALGADNTVPLVMPAYPNQPANLTQAQLKHGIPAGISYMVVKDTNLIAGMKFFIDFQGGPSLSFSSSLP